MCYDRELTGEYRYFIVTHPDLFALRINDASGMKNCSGPGEFQRNQKFSIRPIAVDVISGLNADVQLLSYFRAAFGSQLRRRLNGETLRQDSRK